MDSYDTFDFVPDLSNLIGCDMPDEIATRSELERLDVRSEIYSILDELHMVKYSRAIA